VARFTYSDLGEIDDAVRIQLGNEDVHICESYTVACSVFSQPAAWSVDIGHADIASKLWDKYPPNTPFSLFVGDVLQQSGKTDGRGMRGGSNGTTVTLKGRDALAPLHDDHISDERSYTDSTYVELVKRQLELVGLGDAKLEPSNRANRKIKAGVNLVELAPPRDTNVVKTDAAGDGVTHQQIIGKLGEQRYEFIKRYLQLAGLFLWAGADGQIGRAHV
jgi:hypothetical protein